MLCEILRAAEVRVVETTGAKTLEVIKPYLRQTHTNLTFWDVPGFGTDKVPQSTNLEDIKFESYDFFLIVSATRCF